MAQSNNLVAAALNKAGITKGPNDNRGVVGRVAGGGGAGGTGASSRISSMDIDRDGPGGGRPGRGRKHHSTTSRTPYSSSSRPARPALLPSRPATGRSSSVPQTASSSSHTHSNNLHSSTGRPGRDRNGPGSGGRRAEGTGAGGKKEGVDGGQHVKTLKEWVGTRKRGKGLIDLSAMANDPILLDAGLKPPGHPDAFAQMGDVVWKVVGEDDVQTHTISLRENNFNNLRQLSRIGFYLPHIRALDLSGNDGVGEMTGSGGVDVLSCHPTPRRADVGGGSGGGGQGQGDYGKNGLRFLKEIILTGSRLRRDAEKHDRLHTYIRDMFVRFPNLTMLDGQAVPRIVLPVDTDLLAKPILKAQMDQLKQVPFTWPFDVRGKWADTGAMGDVASAFLAKFFQLFDNDRDQLLVAYARNATCSMNFTSAVPPRAKVAGYQQILPNQKSLTFDKLKKQNHRNLAHTGPTRWSKSLIVATDETKLSRWLKEDLPGTRHPLDEESKWMYDVIGMDPVNGVGRIMLIVHGEFAELPSNGIRSFSRTMVIAESTPGTPAQLAGWPGTIISDTFSIRQYCGTVDFTKSLAVNGAKIVGGANVAEAPNGLAVGGGVGVDPIVLNGVSAEIASLPNLTTDQMLMIAEVQNRTGLQTKWAADLVVTSGFDLALAGTRFEEMRGQIPLDYFITR